MLKPLNTNCKRPCCAVAVNFAIPLTNVLSVASKYPNPSGTLSAFISSSSSLLLIKLVGALPVILNTSPVSSLISKELVAVISVCSASCVAVMYSETNRLSNASSTVPPSYVISLASIPSNLMPHAFIVAVVVSNVLSFFFFNENSKFEPLRMISA